MSVTFEWFRIFELNLASVIAKMSVNGSVGIHCLVATGGEKISL